TWNAMCAACHNTGLRKNYNAAADTYATIMAERGVGCEACHGPMAAHVAWQRDHPPSAASPTSSGRAAASQRAPTAPAYSRLTVARPAPGQTAASMDPTLHPLSRDQMLDTCGACHARRAELTGGFVPGDRFLDHYSLVIPDETDVFYADGRVRAEDYEFTSFLGSRMCAAGVRCVDCHEPHSGKIRAAGNALCLQCHQGQMPAAPRIDPAAHSHHALDKPGGRCVDCHMPPTVYMQRHPRRDHGFTIPDPVLTREFGIPNACNGCHVDRATAWALAAVERWYGAKMNRPSRSRAQVVAGARLGQATAVAPLLDMLRGEKIALWRAVAAGLLKRWVAESNVVSALSVSAADSDPLVRAQTARAWETLARADAGVAHATLGGLLRDPVRAVRVEAAWGLRTTLDTNAVAGVDLRRFLETNLDEPNGAFQQGVFALDRGEADLALAWFRRAVDWDGGSAPLRQALAVGLSLRGDIHGAVGELETACRLAPRDAEYPFKLGLALNEAGRLDAAVRALEQAVKLDPGLAQGWYNLGLGYSAQQQPERAWEALVRAESLDSSSPEIPYARATVLARLGRVSEARAAAQRALELRPDFGAAANLLQALAPHPGR
ncbi:MAG: tetratricopeptide repeat protein, partial [Verrucomicrobia bacterium]|nr:tetratricopeptide repeat protein [Verrucomicrobiota bacterium]